MGMSDLRDIFCSTCRTWFSGTGYDFTCDSCIAKRPKRDTEFGEVEEIIGVEKETGKITSLKDFPKTPMQKQEEEEDFQDNN